MRAALTWALILGMAGAAYAVDINIPMDQQINVGQGDAIFGLPGNANYVISFEPPDLGATQGFARLHMLHTGGGYFYGPYVDFRLAGLGDLDLTSSGCTLTLEADLRYFQASGTYGDAPVRLRAYNYAADNTTLLGYRDYDFSYMVQRGDVHYPTWGHMKVALNNPDPTENRYAPANPSYTDVNSGGNTFDPTHVSRIRFWGTDWIGTGADFLDMKNLRIFSDVRVGPELTLETAYPDIQYTLNHFITSICSPPLPTWSVVGPAGMTIDANSAILTWTPTAADLNQTYPVTVTATNGVDTRTEDFNIQVIALPPVIKTVPNGVAYADSMYVYSPSILLGTPPITWSKSQGPASLTVNAATGAVSGWTPTLADVGNVVTLGVQATNIAGSDTKTWDVQVLAPLAGGVDVAPPWGTVAGNISGTQSTDDPGMVLDNSWGNGVVEDWSLDLDAAGLNVATAYGRISFDEDGNLYWKTADGFLASVSPAGNVRWTGSDGGNPVDLGIGDVSSPVVGAGGTGNVYVTSDSGVVAFAKTDGSQVWNTALPNAAFTGNTARLTPVLYQGYLYVVGTQSGTKGIYVLDAATGSIVVDQLVGGFNANAGGEMTLVPNALGAGLHGLYFNADGGGGAGMYCVGVNPTGAILAWKDGGGKVNRSHVIYDSTANRVCTHTWNDYGATFYSWNLDGSALGATGNVANNAGHGYEDLGAVDFNGDVIAGGFSGTLVRYQGITAPGEVTTPLAQVVYDSAGFEGFTIGSLIGQDGWAMDNAGTPAQGEAQVAADPTGSGHGNVIVFAPIGTSTDDYTTYMGAVKAAACDDGKAVTIEWDQYYTDTQGFMWLADNVSYDGWWALMHNGSGLQSVSHGGSMTVPVTAGAWQHVTYTFNPAAGTVTLAIDGQIARSGNSDTQIAGIDFEFGPGASGTGPLYIDNVVIRQGAAPTPSAFSGTGYYQMSPLYLENRGYGGIFANADGHSIVLTGTSNNPTAHVVGMDVTATPLLTDPPPQTEQARWFDYDTGSLNNPSGGPILGPTPPGGKQHIYYFTGDIKKLVALTFIPAVPGDFDGDKDVDVTDYNTFAACLGADNGPTLPLAGGPACVAADLNGDQHIDMVDFAIFQRCYTGDGIAGNPDCAGLP